MPVKEEEMILKSEDYFVSENVLNPKATPTEISAFLKKLKTTGLMTINTNQGGIMKVLIVERLRLSDEESVEVRRLLGMEDDEEKEQVVAAS